MSDSTIPADMRELEDAGLAGYASTTDTPPPGGAAAAPPPPEDRLRPYTAQELAELTAALTTIGIPADKFTAYQRDVLAATRPGFELLGIGDALAEYGVGHGGGIDAIPAWGRLLAGAVVIGYTVVTTRRQYIATKPDQDEVGDTDGGAA